MRKRLLLRALPALTAAATVVFLVSSGQPGQAVTVGHGGAPHGSPLRARIVGTPIPGSSARSGAAPAPVTGLPPKKQQIKVLKAALAKMHKNYAQLSQSAVGPQDVFDYNLAPLWLKGVDGAGTTIVVIEGWDNPQIASIVANFDKPLGLPNPQIQTIFPSGPLPKKCPHGMVILGSYGSCQAWATGELPLDVVSAHLMAPYAKIVISATPADSQETDDPASNVAPPEMMHALEYITAHHIADSISISDGTGETTYSSGPVEITSQNAGELTAAAGGIPVLVATGDCGVVQNLAIANAQCNNTSTGPDTAAWDDSPWVTAIGGSVPNLNRKGVKAGPDPVWHPGNGIFSEGAGYSSVFTRPSYQNGVAKITQSGMRSVPDITMDASSGTSEAAPLFDGIMALASQVNHGPVGPINPILYKVLGPAGATDGIADVIKGDNSVVNNGKVTVPGFHAAKGFDVATGWGTVNAAKFVPALVAAVRAAHENSAVRKQARAQLTGLEHSTTLTVTDIPKGGQSYLLGTNFLPLHPVTFSIDDKTIATLHANTLGDVTYMINPAMLGLKAGKHTAQLSGMLLTTANSFSSH
jgi:subtilase family serine protease